MRAILIDKRDNVAVVVQPVKKGDPVDAGQTITANQDIETGHKIALCDIPSGDMIVKYGHAIGRASMPIKRGDWVHSHNVEDITEQLSREEIEAFYEKWGRKNV